MRLFVAAPISGSIVNYIGHLQAQYFQARQSQAQYLQAQNSQSRCSNTQAKIVRPDLLHLTLQFIGDADPEKVDLALQVIRFSPFFTQLNHSGVFKPKKGKLILWLGATLNAQLNMLQQQVSEALTKNVIKIDQRDYLPHVTIARCPRSFDQQTLNRFLKHKHAEQTLKVGCFHLYHSTREDNALQYRILKTYK